MSYKIVLFQPYLRKHILNFGKYLRKFEFVVKKPTSGNFYKTQLPTYDKEINRVKVSRTNQLRRFFGIPNIRVKFGKNKEIFFTYGCLLFTNRPYFVYIENGVALYNYDTQIASHPTSRLLFSFLVKRKNLKKLIFMSEAGKKSFLASAPYSRSTQRIVREKSVQIYPLIERKEVPPKKFSGTLRLLFVGMFYIKGGIELLRAFQKIRETHTNVELSIITPLHTIKNSDIETMRGTRGLHLLDANFNEDQMAGLYKDHDLFLLPTYRDGFGLVLVEAISWGMPIICTDQYATTEVALHEYNAFVYPNHPLKDYDPETCKLLGKYYNPKDFYKDLFRFQQEGRLRPVENFLITSIEKYLDNPDLLEKHSRNSLELYEKKFNADKISDQIESVFEEALEK